MRGWRRRRDRLENADELRGLAGGALAALDEEEQGILPQLGTLERLLHQLQRIDPTTGAAAGTVRRGLLRAWTRWPANSTVRERRGAGSAAPRRGATAARSAVRPDQEVRGTLGDVVHRGTRRGANSTSSIPRSSISSRCATARPRRSRRSTTERRRSRATLRGGGPPRPGGGRGAARSRHAGRTPRWRCVPRAEIGADRRGGGGVPRIAQRGARRASAGPRGVGRRTERG